MFRYHPDPLATGSALRSDHVCSVCGLHREVQYRGPIYGDQPESLCLHCIHSGDAAQTLGGTFAAKDDSHVLDMPAQFSDDLDVPDEVSRQIIEEIIHRTPGFFGWQQQSWLYHCGNGAAFLGSAGYLELEPYPDAIDMLRESHRQYGWSPQETEQFLRQLDRAGEPTAYLFRCLHCHAHLASWDMG